MVEEENIKQRAKHPSWNSNMETNQAEQFMKKLDMPKEISDQSIASLTPDKRNNLLLFGLRSIYSEMGLELIPSTHEFNSDLSHFFEKIYYQENSDEDVDFIPYRVKFKYAHSKICRETFASDTLTEKLEAEFIEKLRKEVYDPELDVRIVSIHEGSVYIEFVIALKAT